MKYIALYILVVIAFMFAAMLYGYFCIKDPDFTLYTFQILGGAWGLMLPYSISTLLYPDKAYRFFNKTI